MFDSLPIHINPVLIVHLSKKLVIKVKILHKEKAYHAIILGNIKIDCLIDN